MRIVVLAALLVASSCKRPPDVARDASVPEADASVAPPLAAADAAPSPDARAPLAGVPWQLDLVDDDPKATKLGVLSVPLGARERRPLVIALHGGSDRPEWACGAWRGITDAYAFVVCPRGVGSDAALAWSSPADTKARVARAVAATKKRFADWIADSPILLVGFSMGATQAALLAEAEPALYRRVALSESAYAPEPVTKFARTWAAGGGERALYSCTTGGCEAAYRAAAKNVAAHHVPARLNIAGTNAHGMWDVVVSSMRRDWPWMVEGAPGWEGYTPPADLATLPGKTETYDAR